MSAACLQMPYGQVDRLCKLVPNNPANPVTLPEAIEGEPRLQEERDNDPSVANLLETAQRLEGLYRHASTHAAGMVIGDRPLDELVPLYRDPRSNFPITQFNWKLVEAAGLVKFDFLGLKTLTVLQKAVELIKRGRGIDLDLSKVPLDDKASYELLARADTVGVFQLESTGMRESLKKLKPDRFEDIIAMVSLYRPGPMDNIPTYINRKHGEEPVDCLHPFAGRHPEGDLRRHHLPGTGDADRPGDGRLLARQSGRAAPRDGQEGQGGDGGAAGAVRGRRQVEKGVAPKQAAEIFELVDKFAGYGFNKSHAAAYALVSYHTAYLKANYREEFLAASMTLDMANTEKLAGFAAEAKKSGVAVKPPCVNESMVEFVSEPPGADGSPGAVRYALAALKNIGSSAVETIVAARESGGKYGDLSDFARRMDAKALNKRSIETLAAAGAFDQLEANRALVAGNAEPILSVAQSLAKDAEIGQNSLFDAAPTDAGTAGRQVDLRPVRAWTPMDRLEKEFEAVGFYLSGHPLDEYASVLESMGVQTYASFEAGVAEGRTGGRIAGIVVSVRERTSSRGNKFAFAMFSDTTGQFEAIIFSDVLNQCRGLLEPGTPVVVAVEAELDGDTVKMRVQGIEGLDAAAGSVRCPLKVTLDHAALSNGKCESLLGELQASLKPGRDEVRLEIRLAARDQACQVVLPGRFDTSPPARGVIATIDGVLSVDELSLH